FVTLFFAGNLALFYAASATPGLRESLSLSLIFFVWVGIFNMMTVAQLWAFANDIYDQQRGRRLFVLIGLGASFGAIAGGTVTSALSTVLDTFEMLLVSAAALVGVAGLIQNVHRRETAGVRVRAEEPESAPPVGRDTSGAFAMVLHHRYLLLI